MTGSFSDYDRLRLWESLHQQRATLEELGGWVYVSDRAPDGGTVAPPPGTDDTFGLRDVRSDAARGTLEGHTGDVTTCAFSPDGRRIVSGGLDGALKLWDAQTGRCLATLEEHCGEVYACAYSPDGKRFVSAGADHTLKLRDTETGSCKAILEGHGGPVRACAFSPDGQRIVSGSEDRALKFWDPLLGTELGPPSGPSVLDVYWFVQPPPTPPPGHADRVTACAFSSDGRRLVSASADRTLKVWDARTRTCEAVLEGHTGEVTACAYSPDGWTIVSASHDKTLKLWNAVTCIESATLEGHAGEVTACAFSLRGEMIVSASHDQTLKLWDARSGAELLSLPAVAGLLARAFSPLGDRVCCGGAGGSVSILELTGGVAPSRTAPRGPEPTVGGSGERDGDAS